MKPTGEPADARRDFGGEESTNVMGADLLSSLTERSRRIDLAAPPVPEPEITVEVDEVEPVTTLSPAARPQLLVVDGEYPVLGDEEATALMEEPEPTTVAVRPHRASPAPPAPLPAPVAPQPLPAPSVPDPQWAAELAPGALPAIAMAPPDERAPQPALGSRRMSMLAAVALGVAAWTLGLGHHLPAPPPPAAISSPAPSASRVVVTPWGLRARASLTLDRLRAALGAIRSAR